MHAPSPKSVGREVVYWDNLCPTLARDSAKIEYISGGQPLFYELTFVVELGPNLHSKNYKWASFYGVVLSRFLSIVIKAFLCLSVANEWHEW